MRKLLAVITTLAIFTSAGVAECKAKHGPVVVVGNLYINTDPALSLGASSTKRGPILVIDSPYPNTLSFTRFDDKKPSSYMWGGHGNRWSAIMYIDAERCEIFVFGMRVA